MWGEAGAHRTCWAERGGWTQLRGGVWGSLTRPGRAHTATQQAARPSPCQPTSLAQEAGPGRPGAGAHMRSGRGCPALAPSGWPSTSRQQGGLGSSRADWNDEDPRSAQPAGPSPEESPTYPSGAEVHLCTLGSNPLLPISCVTFGAFLTQGKAPNLSHGSSDSALPAFWGTGEVGKLTLSPSKQLWASRPRCRLAPPQHPSRPAHLPWAVHVAVTALKCYLRAVTFQKRLPFQRHVALSIISTRSESLTRGRSSCLGVVSVRHSWASGSPSWALHPGFAGPCPRSQQALIKGLAMRPCSALAEDGALPASPLFPLSVSPSAVCAGKIKAGLGGRKLWTLVSRAN